MISLFELFFLFFFFHFSNLSANVLLLLLFGALALA